MANGKLSRAHVGLALTSALIVLLAGGVAISRISDGDGESPVATGGSSTSSSVPGLGQPGPATSSGSAIGADTGGVAEQPAAASGEADSGESAVVHGVNRSGRKATGGAPTSDSSAAAAGAPTGSDSGSGSAAGPGASGDGVTEGGGGGGGQEPPAPNQLPPDKTPLATAHVSAGEGEQGAVVGVDLANDELAEADVTVGTNQLVGDHPPSDGTGVDFGGRLLIYPPSSAPAPT
ncbi:MAG TPA: hypothetical protein VJS45_08640 [Acidimicrobiia bacterium]|nr:hypothetical protein [Acidimicrobiia bacterium]